MKKLLTYAAPLAMAMSFSVGVSAPVAAAPNNGPVNACKFIINELGGSLTILIPSGPVTFNFDNVGDCVFWIRNNQNATLGAICNSIDAIAGLENTPWGNKGQCIQNFN